MNVLNRTRSLGSIFRPRSTHPIHCYSYCHCHCHWLALALTWILTTGCAESATPNPDLPQGAIHIGTIQAPDLKESSGLAPCRSDTNVIWTHNDGKRSTLYAITRSGELVNHFVVGVSVTDWEDIASDNSGHLYVADIGNNDAKRRELQVHEIEEPDPKSHEKLIPVRRSWRLRFPAESFDCESLFVWEGNGYLISKVFKDARAGLYRFPLTNSHPNQPLVLEAIGSLKIDSPVTGADISPDGKRVALVSRRGVCLLRTKGGLENLDQHKPVWARFRHEHIEGICFVPEGVLVSAESREIYLFRDEAFRRESGPGASTPPPAAPAQ